VSCSLESSCVIRRHEVAIRYRFGPMLQRGGAALTSGHRHLLCFRQSQGGSNTACVWSGNGNVAASAAPSAAAHGMQPTVRVGSCI